MTVYEYNLKHFSFSAAMLHILAMALMLMDHLWATLFPAQEWLTCAGRLAFPIFALMTVKVLGINIMQYLIQYHVFVKQKICHL